MGGSSCFGKSIARLPVGSGHCSSPFPASASFRLRPWRHVCRTRFAFGFGGSARPASSGKPRSAGCGIIGLRWVVQAGSIGLRQFLGHCCLTIHSSRRRFATRLNSGVRPQWVQVGGGSGLGKSTGRFPVGSGHRSSPFSVSASSRLRPWPQVHHTWFAFGFGGSALPASPGKPRLAGCGIIGLRLVVQAGSIGLSASFSATAA